MGAVRHNSADVEFATKMVAHRAQAVAMANLTLGEKLDSDPAVTAERMLRSQSAAVTKMSDLLQDWGGPVPRTMIDHHKTAIQMAKAERAEGASPAARRLASQIIRPHQVQLQQLRGYL